MADDQPATPPICDCCQRPVQRVRSSIWHAPHKICIACFFVWYDDGITDPGVLGPEIVRREESKKWPFPDPQLARVEVGFG